MDGSLQVTPNGHIFYARQNGLIGLIGSAGLTGTLPGTTEYVYAGEDRKITIGETLNLTVVQSFGGGTFAWSKLSGPGEVNFSDPTSGSTTAKFSVPGNFVLQVAGTGYSRTNRDLVNVVVIQSMQPLLAAGAQARYRVPLEAADANDGTNAWYSVPFQDAQWPSGPTVIGYERSVDGTFDPQIATSIETAAFGINRSVYLRLPFLLPADPARILSLELRMKFDDGFVAYVNGQEITRSNAPVGTVSWNDGAPGDRTDAAALTSAIFDVTGYRSVLHRGTNVLAIQLLNNAVDDSDLLVVPELFAAINVTPYDAWLLKYASLAGAAAEPSADPDGDGLPNFYEFASGGNPESAESGLARTELFPRPRVIRSGSDSFFEVVYPRRKDPAAAGLTYQILFSPDLSPGSWRVPGSARYPIQESSVNSSTNDAVEVVTLRLMAPISDASRVFCRFEVQFQQP